MRTSRFIVTGAAIATALGMLSGAPAQAQRKYHCWEENGRQVCGDAMPASAVNSARSEISQSGMRRNSVGRALNESERAAQTAAEERQRQAAAAVAAQARADNALAESYDSEEALRRAFQTRYTLLDEGLKTAEMQLQNQRRDLLRMLHSAADAELMRGKVNDHLAENVQTQRRLYVDTLRSQRQQQEARAALDGELENALARWRGAKGRQR